MGIADSYPMAFYKAQEASGISLPLECNVLITVADEDKPLIIESAKKLTRLGFKILATGGTNKYLEKFGIESTEINKINQGRPNIVDAIKNGDIQLIVN